MKSQEEKNKQASGSERQSFPDVAQNVVGLLSAYHGDDFRCGFILMVVSHTTIRLEAPRPLTQAFMVGVLSLASIRTYGSAESMIPAC